MLVLKSNDPVSFQIAYDVALDGKTDVDIEDAKLFFASHPSEADSTYFLKQYGSGLSYSGGNWTVDVGLDDLKNAVGHQKYFNVVLAIKYTGVERWHEPTLYEVVEGVDIPLKAEVKPHYFTE